MLEMTRLEKSKLSILIFFCGISMVLVLKSLSLEHNAREYNKQVLIFLTS